MADLDDFFAKKDRKKSKAVKKFATADELAKKLDEPKQKSDVRPKKERPIQEGDEPGRAAEEEWKEYEEPVKDYTGLKLQVLQGGAGQPDAGRDSAAEDSAPEHGRHKGPWNKPSEAEAAAPAPAAEPVAEPPPREAPPKQSNVYVPPASRLRSQPEPAARRPQPKHLPDIHNDDYFPVLGAAAKRGGGWSTAGAAPAPRHATRAPLALGNRFNELQDDS